MKAASWVVYLMTVRNNPEGVRAVCDQSEWEKLQRDRPGYHKLIQDGIATENEADRLARGTSGDDRPRSTLKARWSR
ncbi:MAG: hypothetical protein U0793_11605 [Gemmataceae bacterium]